MKTSESQWLAVTKSYLAGLPPCEKCGAFKRSSDFPADSGWGDDPERFFGHVTIKVDPGEDDYTPRTHPGKGGSAAGDDDIDDDSFSGMSGISEDDDEVPFGPSRNAAGEGAPSKSLEILRRMSYHGGHAPPGLFVLLAPACILFSLLGNACILRFPKPLGMSLILLGIVSTAVCVVPELSQCLFAYVPGSTTV